MSHADDARRLLQSIYGTTGPARCPLTMDLFEEEHEVKTNVERIIEIAREADPDTWAKVDIIARIIDPSAYADISGLNPTSLTQIRLKYARASAEEKAWRILTKLGVVPELFDWTPILERMKDNIDDGDES